MRIGIIGATGKAGKKIMEEAVNRGHDVTAIVRDVNKLLQTGINKVEKDIFELRSEDLRYFDVVVNAFGAPSGREEDHEEAGRVLIQALQGTTTRLIVVGRAGTLYVDGENTTKWRDTAEYPGEAYLASNSQERNLEELRQSENLNWTFISPSARFDPEGLRTGRYWVGKDRLLSNEQGESYISYADFAIAVVDEIENPKHIKERFTVVGEKG